MWTSKLFVMLLCVWFTDSLVARIRNTAGIHGPGLGVLPQANQGYGQLGPGFGVQPASGRQLVPVVHSSLLSGMTSIVVDGDVLQEKPCGSSIYPSQLHGLRVQTVLDAPYTCRCKLFSDSFDLRTIDNSFIARMDCLTDVSGYYCCLGT